MLNNLMAHLAVRFEDLKDREDGQGMIEYALLAALISVIAIGAITAVGGNVDTVFGNVRDALADALP
jgi:pilus assembly protein Flp/PilA